MRKLLFTIACALNVVLCFAQDKPVVAVEQFTSSGASTNYVSLIRNKVIEGIQGTGRIIVRDVESDKILTTKPHDGGKRVRSQMQLLEQEK